MSQLKQQVIKDAKLFVNGEYRDSVSGESFDTIDPATNNKLASVAKANEADVNHAVDAKTAYLRKRNLE